MDNLSPYRLTIIGAIVVLVLSVGIVTVLGGAGQAAPYLGLVGTVALPGLLALFKLEQNTQTITALHMQNKADLATTNNKLDDLAMLATQIPVTRTPPKPPDPSIGGSH